MNNAQVAHAWAAQRKESGKGSSFYFDGPTIYSYGRHFPIATFTDHTAKDGRRIVLFTVRGYSNTTAKHISLARGALYGLGVRVIECRDVDGNASSNLRDMQERYNTLLLKASRARTNGEFHLREAADIADMARDYCAAYGLEYPEFPEPDAYSHASGPHYTGDGRMVCDERTLSGLRDCGAVDELFPRLFEHRGWFADDFQDETWRGRVWQLPARNGECLYLAGYTRPNAGDAVISLHVFREDNPGDRWDTRTNTRDAAIRADEMAERDAEESREYSERWSKASGHDSDRKEARETLAAARQEARETIAAWRLQQKTGPLVDSVCAMLRQRVHAARADMREALQAIDTATDAIADCDMAGEFPA